MHEELANCLFKLAQEKRVVRLTDRPAMTIAVDLGRKARKQTNKTYCAPLAADLFLFCYERDFMFSLSDDKQADVTDALNTIPRYLDDF